MTQILGEHALIKMIFIARTSSEFYAHDELLITHAVIWDNEKN